MELTLHFRKNRLVGGVFRKVVQLFWVGLEIKLVSGG